MMSTPYDVSVGKAGFFLGKSIYFTCNSDHVVFSKVVCTLLVLISTE